MLRQALSMAGLLALCAGCARDGQGADVTQAGDAADVSTLFTLMPASHTRVEFANRLKDTRDANVFTYRNYYNGGGVGIADLNGDGRPEIVLTSNNEGARIYLNEGEFRFREVTGKTGVESARESWTTGVLIADVNGDGRLDMYLSKAGPFEAPNRANELWLNEGSNGDGVPRFREAAKELGVADEGYSTHAAVLDFDRDGDLDIFVINNSPKPVSSFGLRNLRHVRDANGGAKLFRNDGARFTDVSAAAGIHSPEIAFALGIAVGDMNRDGWPDVYVANDFFERDYLYVNKGDGTFSEALDRQMPVLSYFSMGLDVADVDNDQWPDVYTTDMLPEDEYRLKTTTMFEGWDIYTSKLRNNYHHQLMRNMLQRNEGDGTFTDIGEAAGVARTDWSWSALIVDLDIDGRKDIFVTNGLAKDITSQDYVSFLANEETMKSVTSGGKRAVDFDKLTKAMTSTPLPNYAFRNGGGMSFANAAKEWGLATPSFSNGAAYGDLDGDGDPDLVVNNVNQQAFVYRNNARQRQPDRASLSVKLDGEGKNRFGVGARVTVYPAGESAQALMQEQSPSRGFQSSVDYTLVFGLGAARAVDSVVVVWPDTRVSRVASPTINSLVSVAQSGAAAAPAPGPTPRATTYLAAATGLPDVRHTENTFVDFDRERLIPRMVSIEGPALATGDVNGDGLDDVYLGGAKEHSGQLLLQTRAGGFVVASGQPFGDDKISEDVGAVFVDVNRDGALDLFVVSGGNEYSERAPALQDRLYINDGRGRFRRTADMLPEEYNSGSRPAAADYDGDGDVDIFVGGRVVPWQYGVDPTSALLVNDGRGRFSDATATLAPALAQAGMVTDAVWSDVDGDRRLDLVVVGEWMPVRVFRNVGAGKLEPLTIKGLERSSGWWNRIVAADLNADGRTDFVLGNLGTNSRLKAKPAEPATMYVKDFDRNGFVEQIVACYNDGVSYPLVLRDDLIKALPALKARFLNYKDYALKTVPQIFAPDELAEAVVRETHTFHSSWIRNDGNGQFTLIALPEEAQVAPVYGILVDDLTGDGKADVLIGGNFDGFKPEIGRMSAGRGLLLQGDGRGALLPVESSQSGFLATGQVRDITRVRGAAGARYFVARNNDTPLLFSRAASGGMR